MNQEFTITADEAGQRLDVWCVGKLPHLSRAAIQKAIKSGAIGINGATGKPRHTIKTGEVVAIAELNTVSPETPLVEQDFPVLYEDKDVVVINKPAGVIVHAGQGPRQFTVVDWLIKKYPDIKNVGEVDPVTNRNDRPGIVHRLDKETSGALIIAKTAAAYTHLKTQFKNRRPRKEYLALVFGVPGESAGRIVRALARSKKNPLRRTIDPAGKEAITEWSKEESFGGQFSLLRVYPQTGRMHQIRVHLHFLGFPIVGDNLYTFKRQKSPAGVPRHLLHAEVLTIELPSGKVKTFTAPLPDDFTNILAKLRSPDAVS